MKSDDELIRQLRSELDALTADVPDRPATPSPAMIAPPTHEPRRWLPLAAAAAAVVVLVGGLVIAAGRDDDTQVDATLPPASTVLDPDPVPDPIPDTVPVTSPDSAPPTLVPVVEPDQSYEAIASVIENGGRAQLCYEVLESLPPQCGSGLALVGWSWDAIDVEQVNGDATWVDSIYLAGTYDAAAQTFTVSEARIPTDEERQRLRSTTPLPDHSVPCPEPEGGWPARNQEWPEDEIAAIEGYAGSWVDESQQVMTVKFTGDLDNAEAAIRQFYNDAVCVVRGTNSLTTLQDIQNQLMSISSVRVLNSAIYVDASGEWVQAYLIAPDPHRQAAFDAQYGPGVVRLGSLLQPVTEPGSGAAVAATHEAIALVLQRPGGPVLLCLGEDKSSGALSCGHAPSIDGWSWDMVEGEIVSQDETSIEAHVTGTWDPDAYRFSVATAEAATEDDRVQFYSPYYHSYDSSVPCAEPTGGWPHSDETWPAQAVAAIPGYAGSWPGQEDVTVVKFTGDLDAAEAQVRQLYSGALCVVPAVNSVADLELITNSLGFDAGVGLIAYGMTADATGEWIETMVVAPDPEQQAAFDAEFGPGVVRLVPQLWPID